jgi:phosphate-selective porin
MSVRSAVLSAALIAAPALLFAQTTASSATAPAAAAAPAAPAAPPVVHPRVGNEIELGRKYTEWLYTGQFDSLFVHMSEDARKDMESASAMSARFDEFVAQAGEETKVMEEKVVMRKGNPQYWRTAEFSMAPEPVMIRWVIVNGEIWGIGINPASQAPPIDPVQ